MARVLELLLEADAESFDVAVLFVDTYLTRVKAKRAQARKKDPVKKADHLTEAEMEEAKQRIEARNRTYPGFGEEHTNAQWARLLGLNRTTLWKHLQKGLTIEEVAQIRGIDNPTV